MASGQQSYGDEVYCQRPGNITVLSIVSPTINKVAIKLVVTWFVIFRIGHREIYSPLDPLRIDIGLGIAVPPLLRHLLR